MPLAELLEVIQITDGLEAADARVRDFKKTRTRRRRTAGEQIRRYGYPAHDARASLAAPFRASMALTEF
jgi:hypothetical protein